MRRSLNRLKVTLVRSFGWSLPEIAATGVEELFGFLEAYTEEGAGSKGGGRGKARVYADQVSWL